VGCVRRWTAERVHWTDDVVDCCRAVHRASRPAVRGRVLGSVVDAQDVVQEAWLRWSRVDTGSVDDAEGYLVRADKVRVPYNWMLPLGALLGAGCLGLLAGIAVPPIGVLAASGLVLYFLVALAAHLRVHDHQLGPWLLYFAACAAALVTAVAHH